VVTGVTLEQFNQAMHDYATADASIAAKAAKMDLEITKVRDKYADTLAALAEQKDAAQEVIQTYCTEHKAEIFATKRSWATEHGTVGFRMGTPALKTLPKWTWEKVLSMVAHVLPEFVRTKTEVNKELLLLSRDEEMVAQELANCGLRVVQDEHFFIELKKEEVASA